MIRIQPLLSSIPRSTFVVLGGLLISAVLALASTTQTAQAAIGSGGDPSGGGGGAQSRNGWGWYNYSVNGSPTQPEGFRDGTSWAYVSGLCRSQGADRVIAFIVLTRSGNDANNGVVYQYKSSWDSFRGHRSGGSWLATSTARSLYNSISDDKTGFTWGDNVAWFCYNSRNTWTVNGTSTVRVNSGAFVANAVASPGDLITWNHRLRNAGPQAMDRVVAWRVHGWPAAGNPAGSNAGGVGVTFVNTSPSYRVRPTDVGTRLCQNISWQPRAWNNAAAGISADSCVTVPFTYNLVPQITNIVNNSTIESGAGAIPVEGQVRNIGGTDSVPNVQWQLTQIKYAPGRPMPNSGGGASASDPCTYFTGNATCAPVVAGTESLGYARNATALYPGSGTLGDEPVGTHLCFAMSVRPSSTSNAGWAHSQLYCYVVGKEPKIQVKGGDLVVGRGYDVSGTKIVANVFTSVSLKAGMYYGSWGEYGILPSGTIAGMASASGYAGGVGSNNLCNTTTPLSLLSFSNAQVPTPPLVGPPVCDTTKVGNYSLTAASQFDAVAARFAVSSGAPVLSGNVNVASLVSRTVYPGSGTINLSASGAMPAGKWVIINAPNADVRITSNLQYTNGILTRASDIPQLVIIARNITIADNVSNVDAWLFAKGVGADGVVNTCDAAVAEPTGLTASVCNTRLTINGPVIANHLYLYRTGGSDTGPASGDPAEIFNLRPDAYMWASSFSGIGTKARTVVTTELPPRF